jgi:hypothetical protein
MGRKEKDGQERVHEKAFCPGCGIGLTKHYGGVARYFRKQAEYERKMREKMERLCDPAGNLATAEMLRESLTAALIEVEEYKKDTTELTMTAVKLSSKNGKLKTQVRDTKVLTRRVEQLMQDGKFKDERIDWTVNDCANKAIEIVGLKRRVTELREIVDSQNAPGPVK